MSQRAFDAVLFDKDGTLFDFAATWERWACSFLLRVANGDTARAAEIGEHIGFDLAAASFSPGSPVIAGTPVEVAAELAMHLPHLSHAQIVDLLNAEAECAPQAEAVPLVPFLTTLRHAGLRLGVATNDAEAPALAQLSAANTVELFDFVAGFDSGFGAKPGPGQLLAFCRAVGVEPGRAVMVGDTTHDLMAGRAAGMATVAVLTGMATAQKLAPLADAVLPDIGHLTGWLAL